MTVAILGLIGTVIPFVIYLWRRRISRVDTPEYRVSAIRKAVEYEVTHDDENAANVRVDDLLSRLRSRQTDKPGSNDSTPKT